MTTHDSAQRWERVKALLSEALEREPPARDAFLRQCAAGDDALYREAASLLAAHEHTGPLDRLGEDLQEIRGKLREGRPLAGTRAGRYLVGDRIGGGGMGVVHRATDDRLGRPVALKFLRTRLAGDPSAAERFQLEARSIAALEHPNICTVHEIGETDDGRPYLAMPLYEGETLDARIARGPLPLEEAVAIAIQMTRGLAKAHARGIVHRDVKPSNVFITNDEVVKLLDFGIVKLAGIALTGNAGPLGTPAYMSPEQARAEPVDHRTDLWSLGVVLYEMLAGARPFGGESGVEIIAAVEHDDPAPISARRSGIPPALERIAAKALAKDPASRHRSAQDFERELLALSLVGTASGGYKPVFRGEPPMPSLARTILAVVAGFIAGGLVNMTLISLSPSLIPPPAGVDVGSPESLRNSIHLFEAKHFVMPFLAHALGTLAGALVAFLVAGSHKARAAYIVGVFFLIGGVAASFMIPAPAWFIALDLIVAYLPMAWLAIRIGTRIRQGAAAPRPSEA